MKKNISRLTKFFSITAGLLVFSTPVMASTYQSATGKTSLTLQERSGSPGGYYITQVNNREIVGNIRITESEGAMGSYYYRGRFRDQTVGPGSRQSCWGDITIRRRPIGRTGRLAAQVTWKVDGGEFCSSIGRTFVLNLEEPLPRPNFKGDFTPDNANTWRTQTSGLGTWPKWQVTSRDGELNCRYTPNGPIKLVYQAGTDEIEAELRAVNAFKFSSGGSPWLWTSKGCYVRANSKYIKPISLPY